MLSFKEEKFVKQQKCSMCDKQYSHHYKKRIGLHEKIRKA